jgi:hypothetical protein
MPVSIYILDTLQMSWYDFPCDSINLPWDSTWTPYNSIKQLEKGGLKIYPNPAKDHVQIEFKNLTGNKLIEIVDLQGKMVLNFETDATNYHLTTATFKQGVYLLNCKHQNSSYHYKLLKE